MISYNSTGWNDNKSEFLKTLLISHKIGVCALQEHFQLSNNLYKLNCFVDFESFSVGAIKNNNKIHSGRPSGGLSFIYHKNLCQFIQRLPIPPTNRVQGMKLNIPGMPLLLINSYFPTDQGGGDVNEGLLLNILQDISFLINSVEDHFCVVLMGDLNTDFSRHTTHVQIVKAFCQNNNLLSVWTEYPCEFTFYHERVHRGRTIVGKSTIDHFCVSDYYINKCVDATPLHFTENLSKHEPIFMKFVLNNPIRTDVFDNEVPLRPPNPIWNKASESDICNYRTELNNLIKNIVIDQETLSCQNVQCGSNLHAYNLENMCMDLLTSISTAVSNNIPLSSNSIPHKVIPGWSEYVAPYKDQSIFWKSIWISCGRPIDNNLHRIMKATRNRYHYAVRKIKRLQDELRKSKFLESCLNGNITDVFAEIKRSRNKNSSNSKVIDGYSTNMGITDNFKRIYSEIYNSHNDSEELHQILLDNNSKINEDELNVVSLVTPNLVKNIIKNLNANKNDSYITSKSNAFKHAVETLADPISDIIKCMMIHGLIPRVFLLCSLVPLVKNGNASKSNSDNYRLIAISSLLLKIVDHVVLYICNSKLKPSPHQFGFQQGLSTNICTWVLRETIGYFRNRETPVFLCLMDLTKAFDKIKLSVLFRKVQHKIPPILIRILIYSYIHQECFVSWNGVKSSIFTISNGVRQGAVLSPTLFNIYIDNIYDILRSSGFGCKINDTYFGCFAYADDLALLSPSRAALQNMVTICSSFFSEHGIQISTNPDIRKTKTKVLAFGAEYMLQNIYLNDRPLPYVDSWHHLGHLIHTDESTSHDIEEKRREFISKIHSFRQEFGDQDPIVFFTLIRSYFLHFYCSQLWDLHSVEIDKLWSCWHKIIKTSYELPFPTHRYLLHELVPYDHIKTLLIKRFIKFQRKIELSDNPLIIILRRKHSNDWRSTYGKNIMTLCRQANADSLDEVNFENFHVYPVPDDQQWRIGLLKDLLYEKQHPTNLTSDELGLMLYTLCCD